MTDDAIARRDDIGDRAAGWLAPVRLGIGLAQGAALWWLYRSASSYGGLCSLVDESLCPQPFWPVTVPELFGPLALVLLFVPILLLAAVGRLRWPTLAAWIAVATALLALMGWHEVARQSADALRGPPFFSSPMPLFAAAALFIGHHLILSADLGRRRIPEFAIVFDTAWKAVVQLALSVGFTGAFWVLMFLGAGLFRIIGLDVLEDLTRKPWFFIPVSTFVFSLAVHLTDVRDNLIRGVRAVGLMLLSWLLLVMTALVAAFVIALPFTGLQGLWDTGSATSLVLAAAAALIVLINAACQDGRPETRPPLVLRLAVQVASLLLVPLVALAFTGLFLRIGQHGLTPDRIIALACALVGAVFAAGYAVAAVRAFLAKGDWMRVREPTTLAAAALAFVLIIALFSPLLDPARLSVADQVARLERGAVAPDRFDYDFLRFESGKTGVAALDRLTRSSNADIARRARETRAETRRHRSRDRESALLAEDIRIQPAPGAAALPPSFVQQYDRLVESLWHCTAATPCPARVGTLDGDDAPEVLVASRGVIRAFKQEADGRWFEWANYRPPSCAAEGTDLGRDFASRGFETAPPALPDLIVGGVRLKREEGEPGCPDNGTAPAAASKAGDRAAAAPTPRAAP